MSTQNSPAARPAPRGIPPEDLRHSRPGGGAIGHRRTPCLPLPRQFPCQMEVFEKSSVDRIECIVRFLCPGRHLLPSPEPYLPSQIRTGTPSAEWSIILRAASFSSLSVLPSPTLQNPRWTDLSPPPSAPRPRQDAPHQLLPHQRRGAPLRRRPGLRRPGSLRSPSVLSTCIPPSACHRASWVPPPSPLHRRASCLIPRTVPRPRGCLPATPPWATSKLTSGARASAHRFPSVPS